MKMTQDEKRRSKIRKTKTLSLSRNLSLTKKKICRAVLNFRTFHFDEVLSASFRRLAQTQLFDTFKKRESVNTFYYYHPIGNLIWQLKKSKKSNFEQNAFGVQKAR